MEIVRHAALLMLLVSTPASANPNCKTMADDVGGKASLGRFSHVTGEAGFRSPSERGLGLNDGTWIPHGKALRGGPLIRCGMS